MVPLKTGADHIGRQDLTVRTFSMLFSAVLHFPMCNVNLKKKNVNLYCYTCFRCTVYIEVYNKQL